MSTALSTPDSVRITISDEIKQNNLKGKGSWRRELKENKHERPIS